jgi:hypothetical protein
VQCEFNGVNGDSDAVGRAVLNNRSILGTLSVMIDDFEHYVDAEFSGLHRHNTHSALAHQHFNDFVLHRKALTYVSYARPRCIRSSKSVTIDYSFPGKPYSDTRRSAGLVLCIGGTPVAWYALRFVFDDYIN